VVGLFVDATLKLPRALVKILGKQIPASYHEMTTQYTIQPTWALPSGALNTHNTKLQ